MERRAARAAVGVARPSRAPLAERERPGRSSTARGRTVCDPGAALATAAEPDGRRARAALRRRAGGAFPRARRRTQRGACALAPARRGVSGTSRVLVPAGTGPRRGTPIDHGRPASRAPSARTLPARRGRRPGPAVALPRRRDAFGSDADRSSPRPGWVEPLLRCVPLAIHPGVLDRVSLEIESGARCAGAASGSRTAPGSASRLFFPRATAEVRRLDSTSALVSASATLGPGRGGSASHAGLRQRMPASTLNRPLP
jgi:hypothetical protein